MDVIPQLNKWGEGLKKKTMTLTGQVISLQSQSWKVAELGLQPDLLDSDDLKLSSYIDP